MVHRLLYRRKKLKLYHRSDTHTHTNITGERAKRNQEEVECKQMSYCCGVYDYDALLNNQTLETKTDYRGTYEEYST